MALTWVEKNAAYVDLKFRRIKEVNPGVPCIALVEVMQAEPELVREYVGPIMEYADFMAYEMSQLAEILRGLAM